MLNAFRESHPDSKILVVVDSLTTVSSKATFSENDQEFARPLVRFRAIAEEMNCSFLVLHHSNRSGECRGTTAIFNAADQVFKLERLDPKNAAGALTLDIQKTRNRAPGKYSLQYDENTWTWEIVGRVEADGSIEDNYGTVQKLILDFVKSHQGVGFEAEEFAHFLSLNSHTCRRELLALEKEGLINSVRRGRARKVYFVGQLIESNSSRSSQLQPIESDQIDQSDRSDRIDRNDQSDRKTNLEKKQKSSDQYDQYDQYAPRAGSELITTSDHFDQFSKPNCQEVDSLVNDAIKETVTVNVSEAIADTKSLEEGDKIVSPGGTELVEVYSLNKKWLSLKMVEADKLMIEKGMSKAKWPYVDICTVSHKEFKDWADMMSLRVVKAQAIASEPDWQPGDKLLMSVFGSARKYEVEFVGFKWLKDGSYKAIVLDDGEQKEWAVDRLSRPEGGQP